jgi:hypothetical protein
MIRKNQRPFNFTDWQVQQLNRTNYTMRQLNRIARDVLRRIGHLYLTPRQYREAVTSLATVTIRMTSALQFREAILTAARQQQLQLIVLHFGSSESEELTAHDDDETACEVLKQHPAHQTEIASLLELTSRIEELVSTRSTLRRASLNAFFQRVSRFRLAVLKQQRDLQATSARQTTEIKLEYEHEFEDEDPNGFGICDDCHKSIKIDGTTEGYEPEV